MEMIEKIMIEKRPYRTPIVKTVEVTPYGRLCQNYSASNTEHYSTTFMSGWDDEED